MGRIIFVFIATVFSVSIFADVSADLSEAQRRLQPIGSVQVEGDEVSPQTTVAKAESVSADQDLESTAASDGDEGKKIYSTYCSVCHAAGVAGAPKFRDESSWGERAKKPMSELVKSVSNGLNAMPPKGMCNDCTEAQFADAISYMLPQKED